MEREHPEHANVMAALREMFSDRSVSPEETLEALELVRDEVDSLMDALKEDLYRKDCHTDDE